jgi:hypothetical protein
VAAAMAILSTLATEVLIPVAGVIGIVFAVVQWVIVSRVKLSPAAAASGGNKNGGYGDYLIEEEEGLNDHNVVVKCAEIQTAISEGEDAKFASYLGVLCGSFRSVRISWPFYRRTACSVSVFYGYSSVTTLVFMVNLTRKLTFIVV